MAEEIHQDVFLTMEAVIQTNGHPPEGGCGTSSPGGECFLPHGAVVISSKLRAAPKRWKVTAIAAAVLAVAVGAGLGHASGVAGPPSRDQPTVLSVAAGR